MITNKNKNAILLGIIKDLEKELLSPKLTRKMQRLYKQRIKVLDETIIDNMNGGK